MKSQLELRLEEENTIIKHINKEILKCAKRGDVHYYWDITGLNKYIVKSVIDRLEKEGRFINSKGTNFKIIRW